MAGAAAAAVAACAPVRTSPRSRSASATCVRRATAPHQQPHATAHGVNSACREDGINRAASDEPQPGHGASYPALQKPQREFAMNRDRELQLQLGRRDCAPQGACNSLDQHKASTASDDKGKEASAASPGMVH